MAIAINFSLLLNKSSYFINHYRSQKHRKSQLQWQLFESVHSHSDVNSKNGYDKENRWKRKMNKRSYWTWKIKLRKIMLMLNISSNAIELIIIILIMKIQHCRILTFAIRRKPCMPSMNNMIIIVIRLSLY